MPAAHITPSCPYGTYQRAIHGHLVRSLSPLKVARLLRRRLKPKTRRDPGLKDARKAVYWGAINHWKADLALMDQYRF